MHYEPLPSHTDLAQNIAVFEFAFGELEHGRIADRTNFQPSEIRAAENRRRGRCAGADYINQLHSEV
jgi:hypothetical protein